MAEKKTKYQGKRLAGARTQPVESAAPERIVPEDKPKAEEIQTVEAGVQEPAAVEATPAEAAPAVAAEAAAEIVVEKHSFWSDYGYLVITAAVVILVFRVLLQLAYVPSGSMENTIPTDSLLISWQMPYLTGDPAPQRGEVVTFWNEEMGKLLVKRVIGLPGEKITFSDGYVYVNGRRLEERYLMAQGITQCDKTFEVPEGCLLMLGDNRNHSTDSRYWSNPYVSYSDVRARVLVCIPITYQKIDFLPRWRGIPLPKLGDIHLIG